MSRCLALKNFLLYQARAPRVTSDFWHLWALWLCYVLGFGYAGPLQCGSLLVGGLPDSQAAYSPHCYLFNEAWRGESPWSIIAGLS